MFPRRSQLRLAWLGLALVGLVCVLLTLDDGAGDVSSAVPAPVELPAEPARVEGDPAGSSGDTRADTLPVELGEQHAELREEAEGSVSGVPVVRGRVTDPSGYPLADVHIGVRIGRGDSASTVAVGTTGRDGTYAIDVVESTGADEPSKSLDSMRAAGGQIVRRKRLPAPRGAAIADRVRGEARAEELRAPRTLTVRADFRGYERGEQSRKLAGTLPRLSVLDFVLAPGHVFEGRVLTKDDGHPVPGAQVFLLDDLGNVLTTTNTSTDGLWWLNLTLPGLYDLFARHESIGTAWMPDLEIEPVFEHRVIDVLLTGDGRLSGSVAYPDGRAVRALALETRHESVLFLSEGDLSEAERIDLERDLGLVLGGATTDAYGDFAVQGLQPGRHGLRYAQVTDPTLQPPLLYSTGARGIELVFSGHRLCVAVDQAPTALLDPPVVTCDRLVEEPGRVPRVQRVGEWRGVGEWFCIVEPGERYLVRAWASGTQEDWTLVQIPSVPNETYASVALFPEATPARAVTAASPVLGRVVVQVVDAKGGALDGWLATLRNKATQSTLRGLREVAADKSGALPNVPPGEYELRLRAAPTDKALVLLDDEWREVAVTPGADAVVKVPATLGARVRLSTAKPAAGEKPATIRASARRSDSKQAVALGFIAAARAGAAPSAELALGQSALCEPVLAPGQYTITIESTGDDGAAVLVRHEVTLDAGELEVIVVGSMR